MIYKDFKGLKLSALGFGTMRLPVINGDDAIVDEAAGAEMVSRAIQSGVNYFDTAWGYHDGNAESAIGKILSAYPRDSFYLANKFPGYDLANVDKVESIFEEQLKKCRVDFFDFYMFHNVCELNINEYLDKKYGIFEYLIKQKENGRIRHLGFSGHGRLEVLKRFLDAYGEHMEFGQLQVNYLDWSFQNADEKCKLLNENNIPIWVMEPMRGGKLAALSEAETATLKALRPDTGIPEWAFRFVQSVPNVVVTLSGMSDMAQLEDNLRTFETERPLNNAELSALYAIAEGILKDIKLPCTACRYCVSHCPQNLDIPVLLEFYNEHCFTSDGGFAFIAPMALAAAPEDKKPGACIGCGACEAVCPQGLKIPEAMSDFAERLNT